MAVEEFFKALKHIEIFKGLPRDKILNIVNLCKLINLADGQVLFKEGADSDSMVMLTAGSLKVESNGKVLAKVMPSGVVGEMGVFTNQKRSADVIALSKAQALYLPKDRLMDMIEKDYEAGITIYKNVVTILSKYLRENNFKLELNSMLDEIDLDDDDDDEIDLN